MSFSFLHISDLHFDTEFVSKEFFRNEIKKQIGKDNLTADCLVISGDLFNRGKLNKEDVKRYREFLDGIPGRGFTVVVPGNHDLDRSAQQRKDGSYNNFCTRKKLVLEKGNEAYEEGQFLLNKDEKEILYKSAYEAFFAFSQQMGFKSFNQEDPAMEAKCYEVQEIPFAVQDFPCLIKFVLLNTSLIAGQSVNGEEYRERKKRLEKELGEATVAGDHIKAAEVQVKLAKQQKRYEDEGEMIIDEEDYQEEGPGRLSLSREGLRELSKIQATSNVLTIFVGHHGYQFLSEQSKKALEQAMKNCKSGIYLCGHSHQAKYKRFKIGENTTPKDIEQIQAGVLFKDGVGYAQYGFDHGVFYEENGRIICNITSYFLAESASGKLHWLPEEITIALSGIKLASQPEMDSNVHLQDQSEANENKISLDEKLPKANPNRTLEQDPDVPPTPPEKPSFTSGPASRKSLRRRFLNE